MTREQAYKTESIAENHRERGEFVRAGEYYTLAAYEYLGDHPPGRFGKGVSKGLYYLLHSVVCYRLGTLSERARLRCEQGILVAQDMQERLQHKSTLENDFDRARAGAWDEFIGDFAVLADSPDRATEAYDAARATYTEAERFSLGVAEQEHMNLIAFYEDLARILDEDMEEWYDRRASLSFPEWIDHKRDQLPEFYETVIKRYPPGEAWEAISRRK